MCAVLRSQFILQTIQTQLSAHEAKFVEETEKLNEIFKNQKEARMKAYSLKEKMLKERVSVQWAIFERERKKRHAGKQVCAYDVMFVLSLPISKLFLKVRGKK